MRILVGCEESQRVTIELRALGHEAYSCDLKPCGGGFPEWHIQGDVLNYIEERWDLGIFFPDCTYLTCSAEWAYTDGPYHQKIKPGTLVGRERREARAQAIDFFLKLYNSSIPKVGIENPVGIMSTVFRKPDQIIHPYMFGDDASKRTCLWVKNLPLLEVPDKSTWVQPRYVNGKPRWANQTDSGQNRLPPTDNRAELRSKTYPGIARAMAKSWT